MKRFFPAVLLAALVTLTAPFMGLIRNVLFDAFPKGAVRGLAAVLAAVALALLVYALVRIRRHRLLRYGGLLAVGGLLWLQAVGFRTELVDVTVVEKVHILEYGLLAYLLYRAFRSAGDLSVPLLTLLWVTFAGTVEEGMQWWVETRVGEIRDVLLNALSGLCGLVFAASLEPLGGFSWRLPPDRWRRLGDTAALVVLAVGLFFASANLGNMIEDPDYGRFRSWFTREGLLEASARRAAAWAADPPRDLSPWRREDRFLTEAGAHTLYRNASYDQGLYTAARQANLILERYYRPYLDLESFRKTGKRRLSPRQVAELEVKSTPVDPRRYTSPVAQDRIYTRPSKPLFLALLLPAVLLLWGLPRLAARRRAAGFAAPPPEP